MVKILVDTSSDITEEVARELDIELITIPVTIDGKEFSQVNKEDFARFYQEMDHASVLPFTSRPVFGDILSRFQKVAEGQDELIFLTISSGLSGTYESALQAKEMVACDRIHVFDTKSATCGIYCMVQMVNSLRKEGKNAEQIMRALPEIRDRVSAFISVDNLSNLRKGGRIPASLALLGNLLRIKPLLQFTEDGKLESTHKDRGRKSSIQSQLDLVCQEELDDCFPIYLLYTSNREPADFAKKMLEERLGAVSTEAFQIGAVLGTHLGNNCFGCCIVKKKAE